MDIDTKRKICIGRWRLIENRDKIKRYVYFIEFYYHIFFILMISTN